MKYLLFILTVLPLQANIYNLYTENITGKISIQKDDLVIVSYGYKYIHTFIEYGINYKECGSEQCRTKEIERLQARYKTRGISIITIR